MNKIEMTTERYNELMSMATITLKHWQEVVEGKLNYKAILECPACQKYLFQESPCKGCYIAEQTDSIKCENTPAYDYLELHHQYYHLHNWDIAIELKVAAQDVLNFLLNLTIQAAMDRINYVRSINKPTHKHGACHDFTISGDMN